jgi:hypothetical protein
MRHTQLLAALLAASVACHPARPGGATAPHSDSRTISAEELSAATQLNLYDYIQATKPRCLVSVGGSQTFPVQVYMNDSLLGPVQNLHNMSLGGIRAVRYYDASAAQSHFNRVNIGPVIQVITL